MSSTVSRVGLALALFLGIGGSVAFAQSGSSAPPPATQFDFLNPGARSLAMGSAFTALADDATAALTNPAGLVQLSRPEVSLEGRFRQSTLSYLQGGRIGGAATGVGQDTLGTPLYGDLTTSPKGVSFLSFTFPAGRWALAFFRHETLDVDQSLSADGAFFGYQGSTYRESPWSSTQKIAMTRYGAAVGVKISDALSVGGALAVTRLNVNAVFTTFTDLSYAAPTRAKVDTRSSDQADTTSVGGNVGVLVTPHPRVRIGASYRRAPRFDVSYSEVAGTTTRQGTTSLRVPDEIAVGMMANPVDPLKVSVEFARVRYSQMKNTYLDHLYDGVAIVQDANQAHLGLEYVLTTLRMTPALRAGVWYDPNSSVQMATTGNPVVDAYNQAHLPAGTRLVHYTGGAGLSLSDHLEVNVGADFTTDRHIVSASAVVRY